MLRTFFSDLYAVPERSFWKQKVLAAHVKILLLKDPRPQISPQGHREGLRGLGKIALLKSQP